MNRLAHTIPAEWLTGYFDRELDPARRDQVEAHLAQCAECRRELEGLNVLSQALACDDLPQEGLTEAAGFWRGQTRAMGGARPAVH